jgi:hypothetical protein
VLQCVRDVFGGSIGFDPCTEPDNPTGAEAFLTSGGLELPWGDRWFCNPPYGRALANWSQTIVRHGRYREGIALTPARPDTVWYNCLAEACDLEIHWRGRIKFVHPVTRVSAPGPKFPNALFYFGTRYGAVEEAFAGCARVLRRYP